jgi:ABC-type Zn uptake system ZnuABC Zn-binding protein ZnuA
MGDVHPVGNPHYSLDPALAPAVTANILEGRVRVAPEYRAMFERNRAEYLGRLDKVVIVEPWSDYKLAELVAQEAGGQVVLLATGVGAVKSAETYLDAVDYNVKTLAKALK